MVAGQNCHKVKKYFLLILFFLLFPFKGFSENFNFIKIIDLDEPWSFSFISKEELIITEKSGKIKIVNLNNKKFFAIEHNLNFLEVGQGGLLDIIYKDDFVWISYSEDRGDWKTSTSIGRAKLNKK